MTIKDVANGLGLALPPFPGAPARQPAGEPGDCGAHSGSDRGTRLPPEHERTIAGFGSQPPAGLVVSDITNPFFPELIKGFEEWLSITATTCLWPPPTTNRRGRRYA